MAVSSCLRGACRQRVRGAPASPRRALYLMFEIHVIALETAQDPCQPGIGVGLFEPVGETAIGLGSRRLFLVGGALQPEARIDEIDIGADRVRIASRRGALRERDQAPKAGRGAVERDERLGLGARRDAQPAQRVGEKTELLQNAVVGDRAELGGVGQLDAGRAVGLAAERARAGRVEEVGPEDVDQRRIVRIVHDPLIEAADHMEEPFHILAVGIVGIARRFLGRLQGEVEDAGKGGIGDRGRGPVEVAVAALEAYLVLEFDCRGVVGTPGRRRDGVGQPFGKARRMGAPADRFPVGIEDHDLETGKALAPEDGDEPHLQLLDRDARRGLAEMPARVGIAGLDA